YDVQPDPLLFKFPHLLFKRLHEQTHQHGHFFFGASPVFGTEGKERQIFDAALTAGFDNPTYRLNTTHMAGRTRKKALGRPTSVTIHDNGHMLRGVGTVWYGQS